MNPMVIPYPNQLLALAGKALRKGYLKAPPEDRSEETKELCCHLCIGLEGGIYVADQRYLFAALPGGIRPARHDSLAPVPPPQGRTGTTMFNWDTLTGIRDNLFAHVLDEVFWDGEKSAVGYPECGFNYKYGALALEQLGAASTFSSMPRGELYTTRAYRSTTFGWKAPAMCSTYARFTLYVVIQGERKS